MIINPFSKPIFNNENIQRNNNIISKEAIEPNTEKPIQNSINLVIDKIFPNNLESSNILHSLNFENKIESYVSCYNSL